jgi:hypothetical protein
MKHTLVGLKLLHEAVIQLRQEKPLDGAQWLAVLDAPTLVDTAEKTLGTALIADATGLDSATTVATKTALDTVACFLDHQKLLQFHHLIVPRRAAALEGERKADFEKAVAFLQKYPGSKTSKSLRSLEKMQNDYSSYLFQEFNAPVGRWISDEISQEVHSQRDIEAREANLKWMKEAKAILWHLFKSHGEPPLGLETLDSQLCKVAKQQETGTLRPDDLKLLRSLLTEAGPKLKTAKAFTAEMDSLVKKVSERYSVEKGLLYEVQECQERIAGLESCTPSLLSWIEQKEREYTNCVGDEGAKQALLHQERESARKVDGAEQAPSVSLQDETLAMAWLSEAKHSFPDVKTRFKEALPGHFATAAGFQAPVKTR